MPWQLRKLRLELLERCDQGLRNLLVRLQHHHRRGRLGLGCVESDEAGGENRQKQDGEELVLRGV